MFQYHYYNTYCLNAIFKMYWKHFRVKIRSWIIRYLLHRQQKRTGRNSLLYFKLIYRILDKVLSSCIFRPVDRPSEMLANMFSQPILHFERNKVLLTIRDLLPVHGFYFHGKLILSANANMNRDIDCEYDFKRMFKEIL